MLSLGRYQTGGTTVGSLIVIGGYDADLIDGEINWVACSAVYHVQIPLDGIIVNGYTVKRTDGLPMQTIIDVFLYIA